MSLASDWMVKVEDLQEQEPPRFNGQVIKVARVQPASGAMALQMQSGNAVTTIEVSPSEALNLADWITRTFGTL